MFKVSVEHWLLAALAATGVVTGKAQEDCSFHCCLSWIKVYERDGQCNVKVQEDEGTIRGLFSESSRFRLDIDGFQYAFFREENLSPDFDVYKAMFNNWVVRTGDYGKGKTFSIYSSESDLIHDVDGSLLWEYCPAQDNTNTHFGFPGTCAPTEADSSPVRAANVDSCISPKAISFYICSYSISAAPSVFATMGPSKAPTTISPTKKPTKAPTREPTKTPTKPPTKVPTREPTETPTTKPTKIPTREPTKTPTRKPTDGPTLEPTRKPSKHPTRTPTKEPTKQPTVHPSESPTNTPTIEPTLTPSKLPTTTPTNEPSRVPTTSPTSKVNDLETNQTLAPTMLSNVSTSTPTGWPSTKPTFVPTAPLPTPSPTGITNLPPCETGAVDPLTVEISLENAGVWCPAIESIQVTGIATSFPNEEGKIFAQLSFENSSTTHLNACERNRTSNELQCTFAVDVAPHSGKVQVEFVNSDRACSMSEFVFTNTFVIGSDGNCTDVNLRNQCTDNDQGLSSWDLSFGGKLAEMAQLIGRAGHSVQCVFLNANYSVLGTNPGKLDYIRNRLVCSEGTVMKGPRIIVLEEIDLDATYESTLYRLPGLLDPCTRETRSENPETISVAGNMQTFLLLFTGLGGLLLCGCGGSFCVVAARRKRELEEAYRDSFDFRPQPPLTHVSVNLQTGRRTEVRYGQHNTAQLEQDDIGFFRGNEDDGAYSSNSAGMLNGEERGKSRVSRLFPTRLSGKKPCSPRQVDLDLFPYQPS